MLMNPADIQLTNEYRFSRKSIDKYIQKEIMENPDMVSKVFDGVSRLTDWINKDHGYSSKNNRLAQLQGLNMEATVLKIFTKVTYCQLPELFTAVSAELGSSLGFSDRKDGITTVAEMLAVLCNTDAFDIIKADRSASLVIQSKIPVSSRLLAYVNQLKYLPPMVCEPEDITSNFQNPYLTFNDCVILGKKNDHSGDQCLDVINTQNKVPLALDTDFLRTVEEEPTFTFEDEKQRSTWINFKVQSYETYLMLAQQGNKFWLTHKVDKRGRLYTSGYHVNYMGTSFKKASLNFHEEEVIEGVPDHLKL